MGELLNPNVVYLLFVTGLWIGVTATYIPGTGLAEIGSFLLLVGSIVLFSMLPTNWLAVMLIAASIAIFMIVPFLEKRYARWIDGGLVLQAVGGLLLFNGLAVSPLLIVFSIIVAFLYHHGVLLPMMQSQRKRSDYQDQQEVIGVRGRVVKDLDPVGTVYVNKELWRARSEEHLTKDTPIIVRAQDGLELVVEKSKREDVFEAENYKYLQSNGHIENNRLEGEE